MSFPLSFLLNIILHIQDSLGIKSWNTEKDEGGSSFFLTSKREDGGWEEEKEMAGEEREIVMDVEQAARIFESIKFVFLKI